MDGSDSAYYYAAVNAAYEAAKTLGFEYPGIVRLFGYEPEQVQNPTRLLEELNGGFQQETLDRAESIDTIKSKLEAMYPNNIDAQKLWLDSRQSKLRGKAPRDILNDGGYWDLFWVERELPEKREAIKFLYRS